jgi:hypothetical protein
MGSVASLLHGRSSSTMSASPGSRERIAVGGGEILLIAGLSAIAGLIHLDVAARDLHGSSPYTPLVWMMATFQICWAVLAARRGSRGILIWGIAANVAMVALWVTSRTVGVPIGPHPWAPEPVGAVDAIAVVAESVIVLAAGCVVMAPRSALARSVVARLAPVLVGLIFVGFLYGLAGGSQAGGGGSIWLCC